MNSNECEYDTIKRLGDEREIPMSFTGCSTFGETLHSSTMLVEVAAGASKAEILVFQNVENAKDLRSMLMRGQLDAAVIDASLVR